MRALRLGIVVFASVALLAACSPSTDKLTATMWKLTAVTLTGTGSALPPGVVPVADQARYTITFNDDGTFQAQADCNTVGGDYTVGSGGSLTMDIAPSTLVACPEGSYSNVYIGALGNAKSYVIAGDRLTITLQDQGTLAYAKSP